MDEDKKIKWVIILLCLAFIIGSFGILIYQKNRYKEVYFEYNGFAVQKSRDAGGNTVYQTRIFLGEDQQPYLITSRYGPEDLEDIGIYKDLKKDLLKKEIYITMDSESSAVSVLAATEISKITGNSFLYGIPTHGALTSSVEGKNIIIKTCNDVTKDQAIIFLKQAKQSRIYSQEGCIIIEGKDEYDLVKAANRLILTLLSVMEAK